MDLSNACGFADKASALEQEKKHFEAMRQAQGNLSQRPAVTRQDLIDMSLKLQEALSLITQALTRMA